MRDQALARAIEAAGGLTKGGLTKIATAIGVSTQAISQWDRVPPERVLAVEAAVNGAVTRYELRPDIYGDDPASARRAS